MNSGTDEGEFLLKKNMFWKILSKTGSGAFTYKLAAVCGLALTSDAIEVLSVANILPGATCDLKLNNEKKGWINSSVFIGMTIGSLFWGCLGDLSGRKKSLVLSLAANGLFNLVSSFAQSFEFFIVFRLLSGIGVGGSLPVLFAYNSEFQSKENRGLSISFMSSFWAVGGILASGLAWLIIPSHISWSEDEQFRYRSWQWYLLMCSIPALLSAFFFSFMPESPKFLYEKNEIEKTKEVLRLMFKENNPKDDLKSFEEELQELGDEEKNGSISRQRNYVPVKNIISHYFCSALRQFQPQITKMFKQLGLLFARDIRNQTAVLLLIYNSMSFGYYGMIMWFPEFFRRMDMYNGSICLDVNVTLNVNETFMDCDTPSKVYLENLLVLASAIPGNVLVIILVNRLSRRFLLSSSLLLSGISVFLIYALKSSLQGFIFSCIFGLLTSAFWNISNIIMTEVFPSNLRSTGSGLCLSVCRLSSIVVNLLMGYLLHINCVVPLALTTILLSLASFFTWLLKETENVNLE